MAPTRWADPLSYLPHSHNSTSTSLYRAPRPARGRGRSAVPGQGGHRYRRVRGGTRPPSPPPLPTREPRPAAASFAAAGLPQRLVAALAERDITEPFPVQAATLPDALAGENVLGRARTGSGKTLAFGLPLLARLAALAAGPAGGPARPRRPRGLILVPTRELAQQVNDALDPLARALRLRMAHVYGGTSITRQVGALARGVDLVVATPGRLADLVERDACRLGEVEVTVLDEADYMCDLGFLPGVRDLLDMTPPTGQRLLFSATLDREVEVLVRDYLPDPVLVAVDPEVSEPGTLVRHVLEAADRDARFALVAALARGAGRTLVFVRTQVDADEVAGALTGAGVPARALHGGMPQRARSRALDGFARGFHRVLVATDVAARGLHVDGIRLVLHLGPPGDPKTYQHRSGRTARAGADGLDVLVTLPGERGRARSLLRAVGLRTQPVPTLPDDPIVAELAGPPAPPPPPPPAPRTGSRTGSPPGGGAGRPGRPDAAGGTGRFRDRHGFRDRDRSHEQGGFRDRDRSHDRDGDRSPYQDRSRERFGPRRRDGSRGGRPGHAGGHRHEGHRHDGRRYEGRRYGGQRY